MGPQSPLKSASFDWFLRERILSSITEKEFATLPPHFVNSVAPPVSGEEYDDIMPGYSNFPDCFVSVIPFLLASLAYHRKWIESNFEPTHPIFLSRVWTSGILVRLELIVELGCSRNAKSGMVASGIPANIVMANRLFNVELKLFELQSTVNESKKEVIRNVSSLIESLPEKLRANLLENFNINGAVPVTMRDVEALISDLKSDLESTMINIISTCTAGTIATTSSTTSVLQSPTTDQIDVGITYSVYYWARENSSDIGMHPVPKDFVFPKFVY